MTDNEAINHPDHGKVIIQVNAKEYYVRPGTHMVAEIKKLAGIPLADELEQVVQGKLIPLPDEGKVHIKGGETFISHPKDSGSS